MVKHTELKQGDTLRRRITLEYKGTKTPVNLTGCTGYSQFRRFPGGELIANGTVTVGGAEGTVVAVYTATQTITFEPGEYGFDIRLESSGDRKTLYEEAVTVVLPYTERS